MNTLVVGATGELGSVVVRKLVERRIPVRALVRKSSNIEHLRTQPVELIVGDLRDPASLDAACTGIDVVFATANAAVPREPGDSLDSVDDRGNANLIAASARRGVQHVILVSVLQHPGYDRMPLPSRKRLTEQRLIASGLEYTIFRADAFMDVIFPLMGSDAILRGAVNPTVERPFWFSRKFFDGVRHSIARKGEIGILGDGTTRRSYICIDNVAEFMVAAIGRPEARNRVFDLGGPAALSQNDLKTIYERVFNKPLKAKHTPAIIFKIGHAVLKPFSLSAANIMGVNFAAATIPADIDMTETARLFGVQLTSAEEFLRARVGRTS
jgi:uncharacterized protein YbjT (DUF2867 family)